MPYSFPVAEPCPACEWQAGREAWVPVFSNRLATSYVASRQRTRGTICVIPKRHVTNLSRLVDEELVEVAHILQRVIRAIEDAYSPEGLHTWISTGDIASQHRPHAHFNVVPRRAGQAYTFEASFGLDRVPIRDRQRIADELMAVTT